MRKVTCNVTLDVETITAYEQIGGGNLSLGIRKMAELAPTRAFLTIQDELYKALDEQKACAKRVKLLKMRYKEQQKLMLEHKAETEKRRKEQEDQSAKTAAQVRAEEEKVAADKQAQGARYGQKTEFLALVDAWWGNRGYRFEDDSRVSIDSAKGRPFAQRMQQVRLELTKMKKYKFIGNMADRTYDFPEQLKPYLTPEQLEEYEKTKPAYLRKVVEDAPKG
jgi:hypothetical protein